MQLFFILSTLLTMLVALFFLSYSMTHRNSGSTIYFSILSACIAIYAFGYIMEVLSDNASEAAMALRVQYIAIPLLGPYFLLLVLDLCERNSFYPLSAMIAAIYGTAMSLAVLFNDYHLLFYRKLEFVARVGGMRIRTEHGPLFFINHTIALTSIVLAHLILFRSYRKWSAKIRRQMFSILCGSTIILVANLLHFSGLISDGVDLVPISCGVTLTLFGISLYRQKRFDLLTIASEMAIQTMDDAMIVLDQDWCYLFSNESAKRIFPQLHPATRNTRVDNISGVPEQLFAARFTRVIPFSLFNGEDGKEHTYRAHISPVGKFSARLGWSIVIRDTTEVTTLMQQLEVLASTDSLTGTLNRRHFMEILEREKELSKRFPSPMALILFDLDFFKQVNDTHGHLAGDQVLQEVAQTVQSELRPYDIFCRYGGEEFMIFAPRTDLEQAECLAERIRESIAAMQVELAEVLITVTASFGVTTIHPHDSVQMAIEIVDKALYRAKDTGRNRVWSQDFTHVQTIVCPSSHHPAPLDSADGA